MKSYTQEKVDKMIAGWDREDSFLCLPPGDYSQVKEFRGPIAYTYGLVTIHLAPHSVFGPNTNFHHAFFSFGEKCELTDCTFSRGYGGVRLGRRCILTGCNFGNYTVVGEECTILSCQFQTTVSFGEECTFFGESRANSRVVVLGGCNYVGSFFIRGLRVMQTLCAGPIGSRNDITLFFRAETSPPKEKLWVSCGCFFGTLTEFEERVREVHEGTRHLEDYLAAIALARRALSEEDEEDEEEEE